MLRFEEFGTEFGRLEDTCDSLVARGGYTFSGLGHITLNGSVVFFQCNLVERF